MNMQQITILLTIIAVGSAANIQCFNRPRTCRCVIGKPHYWFDNENNCKFACNLDGTIISCEQNEGFLRRSFCKNRPAPCECKVGKPQWTGEPPHCNFICEKDDMWMTCEKTEEYVTRSCQELAKPCKCKIGEPYWIGAPPHNCQFICVSEGRYLTCGGTSAFPRLG